MARLTIDSPDAVRLAALPVVWSYSDGTTWHVLNTIQSALPAADRWEVTIANLPAPAITDRNGLQAGWLRAQLDIPLPRGNYDAGKHEIRRSGLHPDMAIAGQTKIDLSRPFSPFNQSGIGAAFFYLRVDEAFVRAQATVTLTISLAQRVCASSDLLLRWSYSDGSAWKPLGESRPTNSSAGTDAFAFADETLAFTQNGTSQFIVPPDWQPQSLFTEVGRWLRVQIAEGNYGAGTELQLPHIETLTASYAWTLPQINQIAASMQVQRHDLVPELGFANALPLDLTKDFFPFGEKPRLSDTLYLAHQEVFARPGAAVRIDVTLSNPSQPQPTNWPIPPVAPAADLEIVWEIWDGQRWSALGKGRPLPLQACLDPYVVYREVGESPVLSGRVPRNTTIVIEERHTGNFTDQIRPDDSGRYQTEAASISHGLHALLMQFSVPNQPPVSLWAPFAFLEPGREMVPLTLQPVPNITSESRLILRGKAPIRGGRVILHNTRIANPAPPTNFDDEFAGEIALDRGRNDILVLLFNATNEPVAFEVVTVVQEPERRADAFADGTYGFTRHGRIAFTLPAGVEPGDVNGERRYWIRARILRGNYGQEAHYRQVRDPETNNLSYELVPATFAPPSVAAVALGYIYEPHGPLSACLAYNDFTYVDHTAAAQQHDQTLFTPFTPTTDARPALYLGFDRPFANRTMTLYVGVKPPRYEAGGEAKRRAAADDPAQVTWEYSAVMAWKALGAQDESAFVTRGLVRFVGPPDIASRPEFGTQAYWLRARWVSGVFAQSPELHRILTNTTWANQTSTIENEESRLQQWRARPGFSHGQYANPAQPQIEVREPEQPSTAERALIMQEEGDDAIHTVEAASGRPQDIWVRWHQISDFYGSGPRDRHYVLDHLTGQLYFGDGQHGMIPPQGRNNIRAAVYRTGGGTRGNRGARTITQLKTTVPYIDGVTNYEAASGGAEAESLESVKERGPKALRHRDRAVTVQDFEDLAYSASPSVARARALAASDMNNAGQIGIILVPHSTEAQPIPSLELIKHVEQYIAARAAPTVHLWLAGPEWVRVTTTAKIVPVSFEAVDAVLSDVRTALQRFLHPLTGGPDGSGWDFGRRPHRSDLFALLESIGGVDHVHHLAVQEEPPVPEWPDRFLVFSGEHHISVVLPSQERS